MLVDGTKQSGPVACSSIYRSKEHLKIVIFQVEYLGAYMHVLTFSSSGVFLSCYCNATMFSANRWSLHHKYGQIRYIFFFTNIIFILVLNWIYLYILEFVIVS